MKYFLICLLLTGVIHAMAQTKEWYSNLPACPCKNPDQANIKNNDGWAKDQGNINKFHKGATVSYRSYPAVLTEAGKSGQQCCYDSNGNLITAGQAAGTPDKISTCKGETKRGKMKLRLSGISGHMRKDVKPWKKLMKSDPQGWKAYNTAWPPNNSNNCNENIIVSNP